MPSIIGSCCGSTPNTNPCAVGCCQSLVTAVSKYVGAITNNTDGTMSAGTLVLGQPLHANDVFTEVCSVATRNSDGTWTRPYSGALGGITALTTASGSFNCPPLAQSSQVWLNSGSDTSLTTGVWCEEATASYAATTSQLAVYARISGTLTGLSGHIQSSQSHTSPIFPIWDNTLTYVTSSQTWVNNTDSATLNISSILQIDGTYAYAIVTYAAGNTQLQIKLSDSAGNYGAAYPLQYNTPDPYQAAVSWNKPMCVLSNGDILTWPSEVDLVYYP